MFRILISHLCLHFHTWTLFLANVDCFCFPKPGSSLSSSDPTLPLPHLSLTPSFSPLPPLPSPVCPCSVSPLAHLSLRPCACCHHGRRPPTRLTPVLLCFCYPRPSVTPASHVFMHSGGNLFAFLQHIKLFWSLTVCSAIDNLGVISYNK